MNATICNLNLPTAGAALVTNALATLGQPEEVLVKGGLRYFQVYTEHGVFAHGAVPLDDQPKFPAVEADEDMGQAHVLLALEQLGAKGWALQVSSLETGALAVKAEGGPSGRLGIQLEQQDKEFALYCAPWLQDYWN